MKGVFEQGMYQEGESGEFGDLRAYVLARLMWNPDENLESLVKGFLDAFYGNAAAYVGEFLDLLHKRVLESGVHFGPAFDCGDRLKNLFSPEDSNILTGSGLMLLPPVSRAARSRSMSCAPRSATGSTNSAARSGNSQEIPQRRTVPWLPIVTGLESPGGTKESTFLG